MGRLRYIPFILMGFTSMLLQITVLRLLLSTFSGNELDIGITLSFWLAYVGSGSFFGKKTKLGHAFPLSFVLIAFLSLPTVFAIKAIRPVLSMEPGEAISFASTILSTAAVLLPLCFVAGLQFPLAVSYSEEGNAAGKVYGLEAVGAFIGGVLFTFLISTKMSAQELCLIIALINILLAAYIMRRQSLALFFIIPLALYLGLHKSMSVLPWKGIEVSQTAESRYGEITVIKVGDQSSLYAGGHLIFSYPDPQSEEMATHFPMTLHPTPRRILVIGGSPGTIKEFLKYPIEGIDFVELDPKIIEVFQKIPGVDCEKSALKDRRVRIIINDGRRYIKEFREQTYDLIVLNLPQPSTASVNRFYTKEFFEESKKALKRDGVLSLSISQSAGYIGKKMQTANGSIYNSLISVFRHVEVTAQEYGYLFASDAAIEVKPSALEERFAGREVTTRYFNQYIFDDAFSPMNTDYVRNRIGEVRSVNTDLRPSAYLYNIMLWAEAHGGKVLRLLPDIKAWHVLLISALILAVTSLLVFGKRKAVIYCSIFTTGFSGMSFMLAGILAYQSLYGYIYEMIGMLSAMFMIGLWLGTTLTKLLRGGLKLLFYLELTAVILAVAAPLFFKSEWLFYVLIFLAGILNGCLFSTANISLADTGSAGKLYGTDLFGSFLGSIVPALVIVPLFGAYSALLYVAFIKTFSAVMILITLKRS